MVVGRADQPLGDDGFLGRCGIYAQMGAGVALGRTQFDDQDGMTTTDMFVGPALTVEAGLRTQSAFIKGLGVTAGYELVYTPTITNLTDDRHAGGGHRLTIGLAYRY